MYDNQSPISVFNLFNLELQQEHFIQNDGTLSTTADSPSVSAGTALSATSLLVKN